MKILISIYVIVVLVGALATMLKCRNEYDKDFELFVIAMAVFWPIVLPFLCIIWLKDKVVKWTAKKKSSSC